MPPETNGDGAGICSSIPKELIVDASILFSFFKADSARRNIFKKLLEQECKLVSPDFI